MEMPLSDQTAMVRKQMAEVINKSLDELVELGKLKITDVKDTEQVTTVKEALATVSTTRLAIEERRKDIKRPALETCQNIDAIAKQMKDRIAPAEESLREQVGWYNTEVDRQKALLIASRVTQLEQAGFELATSEEGKNDAYVAGDVLVPVSSLARLGDRRLGVIIRKGQKALQALRAEEARVERERAAQLAQEEQERQVAKGIADARAELDKEEAAAGEVPQEKTASAPTTMKERQDTAVAALRADQPAPEEPQNSPEDCDEMIAAMDSLSAAHKKGFYLYTRKSASGATELCFAPDRVHDTPPIPSHVVTVPIHCT